MSLSMGPLPAISPYISLTTSPLFSSPPADWKVAFGGAEIRSIWLSQAFLDLSPQHRVQAPGREESCRKHARNRCSVKAGVVWRPRDTATALPGSFPPRHCAEHTVTHGHTPLMGGARCSGVPRQRRGRQAPGRPGGERRGWRRSQGRRRAAPPLQSPAGPRSLPGP